MNCCSSACNCSNVLRKCGKASNNASTHVLVDEYQDVDPVQRATVTDSWLASKANIWAVGDGDQAIYAFRGVGSEHVLQLRAELCEWESHHAGTELSFHAANCGRGFASHPAERVPAGFGPEHREPGRVAGSRRELSRRAGRSRLDRQADRGARGRHQSLSTLQGKGGRYREPARSRAFGTLPCCAAFTP